MTNNPVREAQRIGQSIWYDNIRRGLLTSGELQDLIDLGVTGVTSNPTIFEKAIAGSTDYDDILMRAIREGWSPEETFEWLAINDIRAAADLLSPHYHYTEGIDGYASLEVNPGLAHDTEATIQEARRLHAALDRPNIMIKVPATPEGIPAIRQLISEGININVTLIFSLEMYRQVMEAYIAGLEDLAKKGGDVSDVASVASFFVSRVDTLVDSQLEELIKSGRDDLKSLLGKAAIANAKLAYQEFKGVFGSQRFTQLGAQGARVQRPLWASTGTKNPAYSDVLYIEGLLGPDTVNTMPPATLTAFLDHGMAKETLKHGLDDARQTVEALEQAGVHMERVTAQLLADGVKAFKDSFDKLIANIQDKQEQLRAADTAPSAVNLTSYHADVEVALTDLRDRDVVRRIWQKDHTVWKPNPEEIANRLGWLTITDMMCEQVPALRAFAEEVKGEGYQHVVLLGMGGSSLGPEVLRQALGSAPGYPEILVLDSTVPAWIEGVQARVDPAKTLFLVSSKSGGTIESLTLYRYFRSVVDQLLGEDQSGHNFVAITDPGTPLEALAHDEGFRAVFLNAPDIGGRYSVLSFFGLVPAALAGMDIEGLLDRADRMREGCFSCALPEDNPGAWLGAVIGTLCLEGRDKLTLVTSPRLAGFGLWAEQLIAESTGKDGTGIVPIAGEPLLNVTAYNSDRQFVFLRLDGDDNAALDSLSDGLQAAGHPVVRLDLKDTLDLGGEFYRWEFATAIAGALLGIHPFDQPDVQAAKDLTDKVLEEYKHSGQLPRLDASPALSELFSVYQPGSYLAIMGYIAPGQEEEQAISELRRRVSEKHRIATTYGYGPRFLHSTGQLHKGGWDHGLFLQLVADHPADLPVPGEQYSFRTLADAQALGDLQALQAKGRRVVRIHLGRDIAGGIHTLTDQVG